VDVTVRIFEIIIFQGLGDASLVSLIVYMLMIMEDDILSIEDEDVRFKYVGHGKFIVDCVRNKAYWNFLVKEYLEPDMIKFVEEDEDSLEDELDARDDGEFFNGKSQVVG